ncbi:hypothetical protein BCIN_03g08900 [Botrytis cinerea B05.10]|uniref:Uncharacterized protein n=1 Tax=Botryotinia fuckeliana (strain B05.10) TaxID=332648 RepID=A0A384JDP0_BOTFB|nr:hypothetical protein BCIN_03g08900 [Botrytis cinerea B05.10]ATZ48706.1 hypothetical protein BCIN_03g08900 [Botrytis cinerea B05.10]
MAISKQQEAVIAKIVAYNPATWFLACESEIVKIAEEDRAEFGKILLEAMDVYKSKVQNAIPILKRGPNLNPEVNMRAWAMMHARFLARLFIKHPTLCKRLCVKLSNEIYNPGWRFHVQKFKDIEKHKGEIEEQVEAACRENDAYYNYESTSSSHLPSPQIMPLQVHGGHDQTTTSNSQSSTRENQPKHVRIALALEKSAAAELEAISKMNGNSFYRTTQEKSHQLHLERNIQSQIALQNGVSDDELDRLTSTKKLKKRKRTSDSRRISAAEAAIIPVSDIGDKQSTSRNSDGEIRVSDNRQEVSSRQDLSLSSMQGNALSEAATTNLSLGIEYNFINNNSSPAESVDRDSDERFSLREMIDAMEFVAEHPWVCENLLVHHVWDEYKLFHEYNTEALKVAEEEIQELNRAAARKATSYRHKGTEVGSPNNSVHFTRSTNQTSHLTSLPPARLVSSSQSTPSEANPTDEANENDMTAAEGEQAIAGAAQAGFGNRNFQLQVATVYRALGVVPTATGPVPSNHARFYHDQSSESFAPNNNAPLRRARSSDRSSHENNGPKRRRQSSKMAHPVVDEDTIVVDTSSLVAAHVHSVPDYIAPSRRGRSSEDFIPAYAPPRRRSQATIGQASVAHGTGANPATNSDRANISLAPAATRAQMREQLQVAAVCQSLGRQNEMLSEDLGNDGARVEMEGVEGAPSEIHALTSGMIHRGRDDSMYKIHHDCRIPSFGLQANVSETFAQDQFLNLHGGAGAPSDFCFNYIANQNMDSGIGLAPHHRVATAAGQYQEGFFDNQTRREQEMGFLGVGFPGPGTLSFNHQIPGIHGLSQPIAALDNPQENFWMHRSNFTDFGPFSMGLGMEDNMDLELNMDPSANILPAPNLNDIRGPENNLADSRGNFNFDFGTDNMPFQGPRQPSHHLGAFNPDAGSAGFSDMKQSFGSINQNPGGINQAPVGFEGMNDFMSQSTPPAQFNGQFEFGNMNQSFHQPGRMDPVNVLEPPRRDRAGARSQPGEAVAPETPHRTRAGTRSQRHSGLSARVGNHFRFQDTESVDGDGDGDFVDGEDEEQDEEDGEEEVVEDEDDEDDFEEESPSKRARHRKDSSRGSVRNSAKAPAKGSAKGTPRKSRKSPVKKGPKVAFNPRPASAPSTLDRGPARRYHQTTINISPGAFGHQLNLEIPER